MRKLRFFDSTLRDGSHANRHQFTEEQVRRYCEAIDSAGLDVVFVGHGNGLGASSSQIGFSKVDDRKLLSAARGALANTKLGAYLIPGFGTIRDNIIPAIETGVDVFEIGCHCTEADISEQHIKYISSQGKDAYGTLMMFHMADKETLAENAKKMESYGAKGVILMDSAGAATPDFVEEIVSGLCDVLTIPVGFHAHNNLGMAISNAYKAIQCGTQIIDGTLRGYGAGAGNCQLELICALVEKKAIRDIETDVDFLHLLNVSEEQMTNIMHKPMGIEPISIVSGVAGVFSAFKDHAVSVGNAFGVDPKEILMEVGKKKAVGGQEDVIVGIAEMLRKRKEEA